MASSILDLSMSRGSTAADTSSRSSSRTASRHSPFDPDCRDSITTDRRVSTTDHDHAQATSSDVTQAVDDVHATDPDDAEVPVSSRTISGSSSDVSDDAGSRDIADDDDHQQQLRHKPRDQTRAYQTYADYQVAAAAAAAASRFLVPFPFPPHVVAPTGSAAPIPSSLLPPPLNFYPLSFPSLPPTPEAAGLRFRSDSAAAGAAASAPGGHVTAGATGSTTAECAGVKVRVKDDVGPVTSPSAAAGAAGHVAADPTYAERRRKNNEAARRSRDARRMKERETCLKAALLQQENVRLRAEMAVLKTEIARLHCLLYDRM